MAELGIIASVIQIADVGLRLSVKLYTFAEIVSTADRSVISISNDVSLTSSVLKELGALLDKDTSSRMASENAVQAADKVVKECLEVFEEIETLLVKKMPNLRASAGEKRPKAVVLLEKVKWTYLQPKLQLLRSNLDRLKSTLLLMLNVITYARQVAGRSEHPSVIADQRSLIEDLARSNQDYIRKFESLKLGIEDRSRAQENCLQKDESSKKMSWPLQELPQENVHGIGQRKRREAQEVLAPHMGTGDIFFSTNALNMPWKLELQDTKPQQEMQENGRVEDELFSHLKHYFSLLNTLVNEVDELKYDIRIDSRERVKDQILQTYQREITLLDTPDQHIWSLMAAQPIASLVDSLQRHLHRAQQHQKYEPKKNQVAREMIVLPVTKKRKGSNVASPSIPTQVGIPAAANKLSPLGTIESLDAQRTPTKKSSEKATPVFLAGPENAVEILRSISKGARRRQAVVMTTAAVSGQQSHGYPIPETSMDESPWKEESVTKYERTPRSSPQTPNSMRPLPSQVSPDHRLAFDSTLADFTTETMHSAPIDKERRSNECLTCCARQMVCDEGFPICQNCIQSGSRCEAGGPFDSTSLGVTSDLGSFDFASPEEWDPSVYHSARYHGITTGGPSDSALARSPDPGEKERNSHRLPDMQFSHWRPPGQMPPPSSPLRNPIPSVTSSSSPGEVVNSQGQQAPSPPTIQPPGPSWSHAYGQQYETHRHQESGQVVIPAGQGSPPGFSQHSIRYGDEATLLGSRAAHNSASHAYMGDSGAEPQSIPSHPTYMNDFYGPQTEMSFDSAALHFYDEDDADRRRSVVDDLVGMWTLLPGPYST